MPSVRCNVNRQALLSTMLSAHVVNPRCPRGAVRSASSKRSDCAGFVNFFLRGLISMHWALWPPRCIGLCCPHNQSACRLHYGRHLVQMRIWNLRGNDVSYTMRAAPSQQHWFAAPRRARASRVREPLAEQWHGKTGLRERAAFPRCT